MDIVRNYFFENNCVVIFICRLFGSLDNAICRSAVERFTNYIIHELPSNLYSLQIVSCYYTWMIFKALMRRPPIQETLSSDHGGGSDIRSFMKLRRNRFG